MTRETSEQRASDLDAERSCRSCGVDPAPAWDTADGRVHLCGPCAAMHGVGCP